MALAKLKSYQGQLSLPFELGEDMSQGDPFYVYDDAGAPKIAKCTSNTDAKSEYAKAYYNCGCMIDTDRFIILYRDLNNGNKGTVIAGRIEADKSLTWGAPVIFWNATLYYPDVCSHATGAFCVTYKGTGNVTALKAGTVDASLVITLGAEVTASVGVCYYNTICSPDTGKVCVVFRDAGHSNNLDARATTITGTVINALDVRRTLEVTYPSYVSVCSPSTDKIAVSYSMSSKGYAIAATLTGTTINAPGVHSEFNGAPVYATYIEVADTDKVVIVYRHGGDNYKPYILCTTLTGVTFDVWGSAIKLSDNSSYYQALGAMTVDKVAAMFTCDNGEYTGKVVTAEITGKEISLGAYDTFRAARVYYIDCVGVSADEYLLMWYDTLDTTSYTLLSAGALNTIPRCLGILEESGSNGDIRQCAMLGGVTKAFTSLSIGSVYYVQDDGTVTPVTSSYAIGVAYKDDEGYLTKTFEG